MGGRRRPADAPEVPGWIGAERHLTLLGEENDERAETRVGSEGAGTLVEWVRRNGKSFGAAVRHAARLYRAP